MRVCFALCLATVCYAKGEGRVSKCVRSTNPRLCSVKAKATPVCTYSCTYTYTSNTRTSKQTHVQANKYAHIRTQYTLSHTSNMHTHIHTPTHARKRTRTHTHAYTRTHSHTRIGYEDELWATVALRAGFTTDRVRVSDFATARKRLVLGECDVILSAPVRPELMADMNYASPTFSGVTDTHTYTRIISLSRMRGII